ncbi:MAG: hypothetical protein D6698_12300, partial [Gammaproteobacteria bacterium]
MKWTDEQLHIFASVEEMVRGKGRRGIFVNSVAGAGKTTMLVELLDRLLERGVAAKDILFVSFNRSIRDEIHERTNGKVAAKTIHAMGYEIIKTYFHRSWGVSVAINEDVATELHDSLGISSDLTTGLSMLKKNGIVPAGSMAVDAATQVTAEELREILQMTENGNPEHAENLLAILQESFDDNKIMERGYIDFDDAIWLTLKKNQRGFPIVPKTRKVIIIDEAQDLSWSDIVFLDLLTRNDALVIGAGDPHQNIYTWRGTTEDNITMIKHLFNLTELSQNLTFRCAKAISAYARKFNRKIKSFENNPQGRVEVVGKGFLSRLQKGDIVICREHDFLLRRFVTIMEHPDVIY